MNSADLMQEFQAANGNLTQSHFDRLQFLGVPSSAWFGAPSLVGLEYVDTADNDRYWPLERGGPHD